MVEVTHHDGILGLIKQLSLLAHPRFASAVSDFLEREDAGIDAYVDELRERNPFKAS